MAPIWRWLRAKAGHPIVDLHLADLTIVLYEQSQEEFLELRHWTRLSAIFFGPARQRAHIEALARGPTPNSFKEWRAEPEPDEAREVFGLLRQAGSPVRPANVEGVLDTASGGYLLEVTVHENGQAWHSEVSLQYRGFEGSDAGPLREACLRTFALAGFDEYDTSVFGPPQPFGD